MWMFFHFDFIRYHNGMVLNMDLQIIQELRQNYQNNQFDVQYTYSLNENDFQIFNKNDNIEPPYSQGKSGICWISSALFCISVYLDRQKKEEFKNIFFSKTYLMFYDKLERADYFIDKVIKYKNNTHYLRYIINHTMTDRGQWNMVRNLICKYGLLPHDAMKDDLCNKSTKGLNSLISTILKTYAYKIISTDVFSEDDIPKIKKEVLGKIYAILVDFFGMPPEEFEFYSCDGHKKMITPETFFNQYIKFPFDNYVSLCSFGNKYFTKYHVLLDNNIQGGEEAVHLSLPDKEFNQAIISQLRNDGFCWCTCDSGKFYIESYLLYDDGAFQFRYSDYSFFTSLCRDDLIKYRFASPIHAIVLKDEVLYNKKRMFLAYNSADNKKNKHYCFLSESWFEKFIFQAVVHKDIVEEYCERAKQESVTPFEFFNLY